MKMKTSPLESGMACRWLLNFRNADLTIKAKRIRGTVSPE